MTSEDVERGTDVGREAAAGSRPAEAQHLVLTDDEKTVLDFLVLCRTARTVAQVCAGAGLGRKQAVDSLDSLRAKGLVTRFNTLVASYAARFPGVEV